MVDDLSHSDRAHDFSVTESYYQKANPEIMKSLDFDPKPLDNVKSMLQDNNMYLKTQKSQRSVDSAQP